MQFFAILPFAALFASVFAAPVAQISTANIAQPASLTAVDNALYRLGLTIENTVEELLSGLGLTDVEADVDDLLTYLITDIDNINNDLDVIVDDLLVTLGLSSTVKTVEDLERALGLNSRDTIGQLLRDLHLLEN